MSLILLLVASILALLSPRRIVLRMCSLCRLTFSYSSWNAGILLWLAYGVMTGSAPVVASNAVTFVLISTIVVLNLIISVSGALSAFEMPYVVTGGGFNTSTYFVVMDKIAHTDQKVGLASAMAVVLLLLIVIVTYAQKAVEKWLENRSSGVTK